jgi:hypothetical protein
MAKIVKGLALKHFALLSVHLVLLGIYVNGDDR